MKNNDKRSYNNADLSPVQVSGLKKKSTKFQLLTAKVGTLKASIPVEVSLLKSADGQFAYMDVQAVHAVLTKSGSAYEIPEGETTAAAVSALKAARPGRSTRTKSESRQEVPLELAQQLTKIPAGYKLVLKGSGYELVKARTRRTKQTK